MGTREMGIRRAEEASYRVLEQVQADAERAAALHGR
jgi:hypothetical protein